MLVLMPHLGADYPEACLAAGEDLNESELDSPLSQCPGPDCATAKLPQEALDFVESIAVSEVGVLDLDCLFDGLP